MYREDGISSQLRKMLLIKVISKPQPTRNDVESVIELTASKVVEGLEAQSMTLYLVEDEEICFRHVYYSPTLWGGDDEKEKEFEEKKTKLLDLRLPLGTGLVGKVIATGDPAFFSKSHNPEQLHSVKNTGFEVLSMLTVPLKAGEKIIGAIQVLNKEPRAMAAEFRRDDLRVLLEVAEYSAPLMARMLDPDFEISDVETAKFIARFTENELVTSVENLNIDENLIKAIGDAVIRRERIFPVARLSPSSISCLMANPLDYPRREGFETATELFLEEVNVAPASLINKLIEEYFPKSDEPTSADADSDIADIAGVIGEEYSLDGREEGGEEALSDEESAPIIKLANRIIEDAYISGASDIHIEPMEYEVLVRYRVDGVCSEKLRLPKASAGALVARLKIMSDLDIAEKRLPQDGRIIFKKFTKKSMDIDLRVAIGPMNFGEKVVMRILDKTKSALPLDKLGFSEANMARYRECINQPYGMLLHCGPTGSGKSMTLFSALREIATPDINVQTAEDPIEYTIPGINQMQMQKSIGLTFATALRCYLRMDPDVILVGEIRDQETAEIAVEAALTGHLLLSTLHTNDAPSTVARFDDMGIEPFMISASLLVVCAQRLMRRVCRKCAQRYMPEGNEAEILQRAINWDGEILRAKNGGCPACGGLGYKGRVGIHELMTNNEELTRAINAKAETATLKRIAVSTGMKTLHQDSMLKVKEHTSTMLEAISTVPPDMAEALPKDEPAAAE